MQLIRKLPPKTARRTGFVLFAVSCVTFLAALTLPFVLLPVSGPVKAGLITGIAVAGEVAFAASLALLGKEFLTKLRSSVSLPTAPFSLFFVGAGVIVWLVATLLLRLVGQYLLIPGNTYLTIGAFVGVAVLMTALMLLLYRLKSVSNPERLLAAVLFALPGMLLDAGTVLFFTDVFPNMEPNADTLFAGWLFWGYSVVLLTGIIYPATGVPATPMNESDTMTFNRGFRLVGIPLFGLLLYLIICYIDPESFNQASYQGPDAWQTYLVDIVMTFVGAYLLAETSLLISRGLDAYLPWDKMPRLRFVIQLLVLIVDSVITIGLLIWLLTLLDDTNYQFTETDWLSVRKTMVLGSLMALLLNALHTGAYFFGRWQDSRVEAERLKRESAEARYEVLRNQLDPHFLFNNLNTLMYLVEDNPPAISFVQNLSLVYRYVLQNRDKMLVPLADELQLADAYVALLTERFGEGIEVRIDIPANYLDRQLPPMTLQLLLENAVKHNIVDANCPLAITIRLNDAGELVVENSLHPRLTTVHRTGIGLQNIRHRYQLTAHIEPTISEEGGQFIVRLPLLLKNP